MLEGERPLEPAGVLDWEEVGPVGEVEAEELLRAPALEGTEPPLDPGGPKDVLPIGLEEEDGEIVVTVMVLDGVMMPIVVAVV